MSLYRRARVAGASYFLTLTLLDRRNDLLTRHIDLLRETVRATKDRHPFHIDAWVVLPEHMHCVWTLPEGDSEVALRWKAIRFAFSQGLDKTEPRRLHQLIRGERGLWQRRYWRQRIADDLDYQRHLDYIHFDPVRHGYVSQAREWPYSSFHRAVRDGLYPADWTGSGCTDDEQNWGE